ncbi:MAG: hypothetical protein K0Q72_817 [Armatimonadetes bacterium]|nr:hypothetical protein [Armatimonadota bacterium]
MDLEGLAAGALFLVVISPCVWYLWRVLDRLDRPPVRPFKRNPDRTWVDDTDAHLVQFGIRLNPSISEHVRRIETEGVEYYRAQFRTAPLGSWHPRNQEPMLGGLYWDFWCNHTGEVLETAVMGCSDRRITFRWREVSDFTIELLVTGRQNWVRATAEGTTFWEDEEREEDDPPEEWERAEYAFTLRNGDPPDIVMHTPGWSTFNALCLYSEGPLSRDWPR